MRYSLSCLLVLIGFVFQVKGFADDSLLYDENLGDPGAFLSESTSDVFTLTDLAGNLIRDDNNSFDTLVPPLEDDAGSSDIPALLPEFDVAASLPEAEDVAFDALAPLPEGFEIGPNTVVVDCYAPDGLGRRDDTILCPTDGFKGPELPTLDGITDKFNPPNEQDNDLKEISPLDYQAPPGDNNKCPPDRPFQLCCNCDGSFEFDYCNDCLQMSAVGACFAPHMEVCCGAYGVTTYHTSQLSYTNLDELLAQYSREQLHLDERPADGTIAQYCSSVVPPVPVLPPLK